MSMLMPLSDLTMELMGKSRAYHISVPAEYLTACGAAIAQWGYFEAQFNGCIETVSRLPEAIQRRGDTLPKSMFDRAKLLRRLARISFPLCPSLVAKICDFSIRSHQTANQRNVLAHGLWFDGTPFHPNMGVTINTEPDGTGDIYSVVLDQIEALAEKIVALRTEAMILFWEPGEILHPPLSAAEADALRQYHSATHPRPPGTSTARAPNRKGTTQGPEPFRV